MNAKQVFILCKTNEQDTTILGVFDTVRLAENYIKENEKQDINFMYQGENITRYENYVLYKVLKFS